MNFIADFHIHSRFSIATSKTTCPASLHAWAQRKGLGVIGTGDFTHPGWAGELRAQLVAAEPGLYQLEQSLASDADRAVPASCRGPVRFLLTAEISNIYKREGKTRKVHNLVFAPDFATVGRLSAALAKIGKLTSDGRPILKLDSRDLMRIVLNESDGAFVVPAHVWTPHFSVLGAFSDFNSIEECYGNYAAEIFAVETGLSSDPAMNWRLSSLDRFALMSNSDAHSPEKLGREANRFDTELSFEGIANAFRAKDGRAFQGTIEFFPQEGKYHYDGHRGCNARLTPEETARHGGRCPACGRKVTLGVCHRVADLADRPAGFMPEGALPYQCLIGLKGLLSELLGVGPGTKRVAAAYEKVLASVGPELLALREATVESVAGAGVEGLAEAVRRMRAGEVHIAPGYDGRYGTVSLRPVT